MFARCTRDGLALVVCPYRYKKHGGFEHGPQTRIEGAFVNKPGYHSFADFDTLVAAVQRACGQEPRPGYTLVGGLDRPVWTLEPSSTCRLFCVA